MPCACPSDTMIWIAMASSAHHAPYRRFVRTQRIQSNVQAKGINFQARKYILSRRGIADVNGAQRRSSDSATSRVPSDPLAIASGWRCRRGVNHPEVPHPQVFAKHSRLVRAKSQLARMWFHAVDRSLIPDAAKRCSRSAAATARIVLPGVGADAPNTLITRSPRPISGVP